MIILSANHSKGGGSELIRYGSKHEPLDDVGRFLSMLRFKSRRKLEELVTYIDTLCEKSRHLRFESIPNYLLSGKSVGLKNRQVWLIKKQAFDACL